MMIVPVLKVINVPIRLLNIHQDATYDFKNAETDEYLYHEGVCGLPEYSCAMSAMGKKFKVISGHFAQEQLWNEIKADCMGTAAAAAFKKSRFAVIGNTYTNMIDMPTDDHRILRATGRMLYRPEVEEIEEAYKRVTTSEVIRMYNEFMELYDVEENVTKDQLLESARIAVAFDKIVNKYQIDALGIIGGRKGLHD